MMNESRGNQEAREVESQNEVVNTLIGARIFGKRGRRWGFAREDAHFRLELDPHGNIDVVMVDNKGNEMRFEILEDQGIMVGPAEQEIPLEKTDVEQIAALARRLGR